MARVRCFNYLFGILFVFLEDFSFSHQVGLPHLGNITNLNICIFDICEEDGDELFLKFSPLYLLDDLKSLFNLHDLHLIE